MPQPVNTSSQKNYDTERRSFGAASLGVAGKVPHSGEDGQPVRTMNQKKPKARAIRKPGVMNKTEAAYADHLEQRRIAGEIISWHFETYTLKLADNCRYTPDFMVLLPDGTMQFHEVKGYWMDDAKVKIKVAARQFPHVFLAVRKIRGGWETTDFTDPA